MHPCYLCGAQAAINAVDLGQQPISNRFLKTPGDGEALFPLALFQCGACGLVQIEKAPPAAELCPTYDWITYNEPEPHLDSLASTIAKLPGLTPQSAIWGISFKDDSLLRRLENLGFPNTYRLDMRADLQIDFTGAGAETIQDRLDPAAMRLLAGRRGPAQVLIVRHIIEHAHDLKRFTDALRALIAPDGYIVLEAPDCQQAFTLRDYTTIWEEHTLYLTESSFRSLFSGMGLDVVYYENYPYAFENSLIGIGRAGTSHANEAIPALSEQDKRRLEQFACHYPLHKSALAKYLKDFRETRGKVALLGAGHLACAFINYLELSDHIEFVADDNRHKQGLFMPGSRLPIKPSSALIDENVKLCLFSFSPEIEEKVVDKQRAFLERGGEFASIFPASGRALRIGD